MTELCRFLDSGSRVKCKNCSYISELFMGSSNHKYKLEISQDIENFQLSSLKYQIVKTGLKNITTDVELVYCCNYRLVILRKINSKIPNSFSLKKFLKELYYGKLREKFLHGAPDMNSISTDTGELEVNFNTLLEVENKYYTHNQEFSELDRESPFSEIFNKEFVILKNLNNYTLSPISTQSVIYEIYCWIVSALIKDKTLKLKNNYLDELVAPESDYSYSNVSKILKNHTFNIDILKRLQ